MTEDSQKAEDIRCKCDWFKVKATYKGHLYTYKDKVKYVVFIRKCDTCHLLRANIDLAKPLEKEVKEQVKEQGVLL